MNDELYDGSVHLVNDNNTYKIYDDDGDIEEHDLHQHLSE